MREAIEAFIRRHNERAKPFRWRKREVKGSQLKNTIVKLRNSALAYPERRPSIWHLDNLNIHRRKALADIAGAEMIGGSLESLHCPLQPDPRS